MTDEIKFILFKGQKIKLTKIDAATYKDDKDTTYAYQDLTNAIDPVSRCGLGIFSLSTDSKYTPACDVHDTMYTVPFFRAYHTESEADSALEHMVKLIDPDIIGAEVGRIFHIIASMVGPALHQDWASKLK